MKSHDHVGQQISLRVADFIQHLLADRQWRDQAAGAFGFADDELAVGADFNDGKADVFVVGHIAPVGEVAAGALGAAFDDVAGQCRLGEFVVVVPRPAEFVHQRGTDHGAVDHAPGNHDVRAQAQGFDYARRAEVGVGRDAHRRQGRAAEHFLNAKAAQLFELRLQVVTQQHGDFQRHPGLVAGCLQGRGAGLWVDPAGIADDADVLLRRAASAAGASTSMKSPA